MCVRFGAPALGQTAFALALYEGSIQVKSMSRVLSEDLSEEKLNMGQSMSVPPMELFRRGDGGSNLPRL